MAKSLRSKKKQKMKRAKRKRLERWEVQKVERIVGTLKEHVERQEISADALERMRAQTQPGDGEAKVLVTIECDDAMVDDVGARGITKKTPTASARLSTRRERKQRK
jgi:hypothetical protein